MEGGKHLLWSQLAVNWTWHTGLRGLIITEATLAFCNLWIRRALCFSCFSLISCIKLWLLLLRSWLPGAQGPWWPRDHVPAVLREPHRERLRRQHAQSVVSSDRQGKVAALLDSLGSEPQVERGTAKMLLCQQTSLQGGLWCLWGSIQKMYQINMWVAFSLRNSSVQKSHLDVKLQCGSCYHWHISLFSWQFCYSCGVVCDMDFKEFGQKHYFIFLKA